MQREVVFRAVSFAEANTFRREMAKHFRHWGSLDRFAWEWNACPDQSMQVLAYDGGTPIAHYGFLGLPFRIQGKLVSGAKAEGAYVRADYTGRAIHARHPELGQARVFPLLVSAALEHGRRRFEFIFGFPIGRVAETQRSAGYNLRELPVCFFTLEIRPGRVFLFNALRGLLPAVGRYVARFRSLRVPASGRISPEHALLVQSVNATAPVDGIEYTAGYLDWRLATNPHNRNDILVESTMGGSTRAYVIVTTKLGPSGARTMIINDLKAVGDAESQVAVLRSLVRKAIVLHRPESVTGWFNKNELFDLRARVLEAEGFTAAWQKKQVLTVHREDGVVLERLDINPMWTEGT